jgi:hypothetical protein
MVRLCSVLVVLGMWLAIAAPVSAQQVQVRITSPANGARVAGPDVTVNIAVTGTTLVPAASAMRLEDLHVHYLLDVDPGQYLAGTTPVAMGDPNQVHTAALSNTFTGVAPGQHRVTVLLGLSSHVATQPPVAPSVTFTVVAAGALGVLAGAWLRRRASRA